MVVALATTFTVMSPEKLSKRLQAQTMAAAIWRSASEATCGRMAVGPGTETGATRVSDGVRRAARSADVMAAVMKDGFSLRDACFSAYDIPAEAVRLEAKTALADETELEEESAARY